MSKNLGIEPSDVFRLTRIACSLAERLDLDVTEAVDLLETSLPGRRTKPEPVDFARASKQYRLLRNSRLGAPIFRDPAWDMLLDLFVASHDDKPLSVSELCVGSGVAATTALRHIDRLEHYGFAEKDGDDTDHRRVLITMPHKKKEAVAELLTEWLHAITSEVRVRAPMMMNDSDRLSIHPVFLS